MDTLHKIDEFLWSGEVEEIMHVSSFTHAPPADHALDEIASCIELATSEEAEGRYLGLAVLCYRLYGSPKTKEEFLVSKGSVESSQHYATALISPSVFDRWVTILELYLDASLRVMETRDSGPTVDDALEAEISRELRMWFNITYMALLQNRSNESILNRVFGLNMSSTQQSSRLPLSSLLVDSLRLCPEGTFIPVRKLTLTLTLLLSIASPAPEKHLYADGGALSPSQIPVGESPIPRFGSADNILNSLNFHVPADTHNEELSPEDLMGVYPLKKPQISNFRGLVSIGKHLNALYEKFPGRKPAAIRESFAIIRKYVEQYLEKFPVHPIEFEYLHQEPSMLYILEIYSDLHKDGKICFRKSTDTIRPVPIIPCQELSELKPLQPLSEEENSRFSPERIASTIPFSWKALKNSGFVEEGISDSETESESECEDTHSTKNALGIFLRKFSQADAAECQITEKQLDLILKSTEKWTQWERTNIQATPRSRLTLNVIFCGYIRDCVLILLRVLLTTCRNSHEYPNTVAINHDFNLLISRFSNIPDYLPSLKLLAEKFPANFEASEKIQIPKWKPKEEETRRNSEIVGSAVSGIFVQILHAARLEGPRTFARVCQIFSSANGCLVLLKFLNGAEECISDSACPVLPCHQQKPGNSKSEIKPQVSRYGSLGMTTGPPITRGPGFAAVKEKPGNFSDSIYSAAFPGNRVSSILRALVTLRLIVKDSPEKIRKYLVGYKSIFILKRLFKIGNYRIQKNTFKLMKMQLRYFGKKAKTGNMRLISCAFSALPTDLLDDGLLSTAVTAAADSEELGAPLNPIHQGPESVAGQVEISESIFEVRDDPNQMGQTFSANMFYAEEALKGVGKKFPAQTLFSSRSFIGPIEETLLDIIPNHRDVVEISTLGNIRWENAGDVAQFSQGTGKSVQGIFFGNTDFNSFVQEHFGYSDLFPHLVAQ